MIALNPILKENNLVDRQVSDIEIHGCMTITQATLEVAFHTELEWKDLLQNLLWINKINNYDNDYYLFLHIYGYNVRTV